MHEKQTMKKVAATGVVLTLLLLVSTLPAAAQAVGSGSIVGRVTDPSGAAVPGAKVTVRNVDTNASRQLESDAQGNYRADLLQSGNYEITSQATGFATLKRTGVKVEVGSTITANLELKVAAAEQVITVTEETPITDPERTEVTQTVSQKQIEDLPINGRRWDNFVLLTPGVIPDGTFGLISYRGLGGILNNNMVDGADNNQAFFSEARGRTRTSYTISQSSVKEFQVGLSNFSAEFGRAAGGTVNAVTKSGTNELHGEVFYYIRDDALQAREPTLFGFTGQALKNKDRRQQYGLTLGLPIAKDKLFFFGAWDQQLRSETYLAREGSGTFFTNFMTTCAPAGSSAALVANCNALLAFQLSESGLTPRKRLNNVAIGKVDWVITPNHTFTSSYNWHRWKAPNGIQTQQVVTRGASDNGFDGVKTDSLIFKLNSVLTTRLVNEAKFQWGRDFEFQVPPFVEPRTTITNGVSFGMSEFLPRPAWPDERRYQWTDTLSWVRGRHTIKTGMDINYVRTEAINVRNGGGVYAYTSLTGLAQDCPPRSRTACTPINTGATTTGKHWNSYTQAFDLRGLGGQFFFTTADYNAFVQDSWKLTPRFTLNAGVRYEYQRLPKIQPFTVSGVTLLGNPQFPESQKFNADTNNWGPRLSFAWDLNGNQKSIFRSGFGVYYGRTPNGLLRFTQLENGVALASFFLAASNATQFAAGPVYPAIQASPPVGSGTRTVYFAAGDYVRPFVMSFDFAFEQEIARNVSVSVTYLYTRANHLTRASDLNLPNSSTTVDIVFDADGSTTTTGDQTRLATTQFYAGVRPLFDLLPGVPAGTRLGRVMRETSDLNSTYNGLIFQLNQRLRWGLTQVAHFTLSKALDEGQVSGRSPQPSTFDDFFDPRQRGREYSRSDFDTRKRFIWNFIWEPSRVWSISNPGTRAVLGDWSFSGIVTAHDGQPTDLTVSGSISGTSTNGTDTATINGSGGNFRTGWLPRNFLETTGFVVVDFRAQKDFKITETKKIRILWEAFNLFNRTNHPSRFNFSQTAYRVLANATGAPGNGIPLANFTCAAANACNGLTPGSASNLTLPRQVTISRDTGNTFLGVIDPLTGRGDLGLCTTANCLRSASGTLFGARDMQFGVRFIF